MGQRVLPNHELYLGGILRIIQFRFLSSIRHSGEINVIFGIIARLDSELYLRF